MAEQRKSFTAHSPGEARNAASMWLRNFRDHGPLAIKSIRVTEEREHFVATVTYGEMTIEESPQYFAEYQPALLKSA
jgi:hypothetical protein